jgi:hypothetical protein
MAVVESDSVIRDVHIREIAEGNRVFFRANVRLRKLQSGVRVVVLIVRNGAGFICWEYAGNTSCMRYMTLLLLYAVAGIKQQLRPVVAI